MRKNVLITGGAGFIGSHLATELLNHGYHVRALDILAPQVHGPGLRRPDYLNPDVELVIGDVRDPALLKRCLKGIDAIFHFTALVGVGQSMYQISEYMSVNSLGTAELLQAVTTGNPVERLIVASSMSIYGEGSYRTPDGEPAVPVERCIERLKCGDWESYDEAGNRLIPVPTAEGKTPQLTSVYALSKYVQERMCLIVGRAYGIEPVALRFFNTYGPYQALSNPYTGVLSNFASRVLNGRAPLIFEDGLQMRDFVSVYDVARACRLALESPEAAGCAINISSGVPLTVGEAAERTVRALGRGDLLPEITGKYRAGDIRHCFADISRARDVLGYEPRMSLEAGLQDLAEWLERQTAEDRAVEARAELSARGLMV